MEDKLKNILITLNNEHEKKINEQISGIFLFGFMIGIIFSYTGFLGYSSGFITGIVLRNHFSKQISEFMEKTNYVYYIIIKKVKNNLEIKKDV